MSNSYYPGNPPNLPPKFTKLTAGYQMKAILAIMAIFLFFILYLGMVLGIVYLCYWSVIYEMPYVSLYPILLKIGAVAGSFMLLLFTLKFVVKIRNVRPDNRIKIDMDKQPELRKFIDNICNDTGAPKPKSVYLDPDVNAYVSYTNPWLGLIFPVKKELTLGSALISSLNLSEFKAVVAHEFGHFAQRSMKIGSYIMTANTIIHDMIFNRDKWDDILSQWQRTDFRLAIFAWAIGIVVWIVRQLLSLFYRFLNIMYSTLSREMEFNADKVAVSVSGSDAIVSALWKLDYGVAAWNETVQHAYMATQKQFYSKTYIDIIQLP